MKICRGPHSVDDEPCAETLALLAELVKAF
jgi:hypothetical protein